MDALTGGKEVPGILSLISARLGPKPDDPLMTDGRKTKKVIAQIYNDGRSKLIHGASADFAHDWTQVRVSAEVIGRWLLISQTRKSVVWGQRGSVSVDIWGDLIIN